MGRMADIRSKLGSAMGGAAKGAAASKGLLRDPATLLLGLGAVGTMGGAQALRDYVTDSVDRKEGEELIRRMANMRLASELEERRKRESVALNLESLAAKAPDLYNQVRAGVRLPKGAVVFGGSPREDLLEQLALSMSEGRFKPQPGA